MSVPPLNLFQALTTDGTITGTSTATGDYSDATGIGATTFYIQPPAGQSYKLYRMIVQIKDTAGIDADKYGNGITLTNGITVVQTINGVDALDLLGGSTPIKTNSEWGRGCYDVENKEWGSGNEFIQARWTFVKGGLPIFLQETDTFEVRLHDDFRGLLDHCFHMQGVISTS